jgi:hypothetical protein
MNRCEYHCRTCRFNDYPMVARHNQRSAERLFDRHIPVHNNVLPENQLATIVPRENSRNTGGKTLLLDIGTVEIRLSQDKPVKLNRHN